MTREEIKRRIANAIANNMPLSLEPAAVDSGIDKTASIIMAIIASLEEEHVAAVANIQPENIDNIDLDPVFSYKRGFHDATIAAIKAIRESGDGQS